MKPQKILIMGLPGAGKTTLAQALKDALGSDAHWYDGDTVREVTGNHDFSDAGRTKQARNMREMCDASVAEGKVAIASFVCPSPYLRGVFDADFTVLVDRIVASAYPDTNRIFIPPAHPDYTVEPSDSVAQSVRDILERLRPTFDYNKPTALMVGRFQPFHAGHKALAAEAIARYGQVCFGIREMPPGAENPFSSFEVRDKIEAAMLEYTGKYTCKFLPNVAAVVYGRDVGYAIERLYLSDALEAISATQVRAGLHQADGGPL
jgi:energy-coupling factor transporter ATP-binding protein EcfA2